METLVRSRGMWRSGAPVGDLDTPIDQPDGRAGVAQIGTGRSPLRTVVGKDAGRKAKSAENYLKAVTCRLGRPVAAGADLKGIAGMIVDDG